MRSRFNNRNGEMHIARKRQISFGKSKVTQKENKDIINSKCCRLSRNVAMLPVAMLPV